MDLNNLTKEQKEDLYVKLHAERKEEEQRKEQDREAYKVLKDETIRQMFECLKDVSRMMISAKELTFRTFNGIISVKDDLFNVKMDRQSNTFTTEDGTISIKLGNRVNEGWDDTVEIGIQKVKEYLRTLAKDEDTADLVDTVMGLLAKDRKGNLKANKVLELERLASKRDNEKFKEGIRIIKEAYRPAPTCQFIEVKYKDETGKECSLPLSMSAI